jgi:hypothetical protein
MNKSPFIEASLEEFSSNDKIKEIIKENKCKSILYNNVTKETNLDEFDFIIITEIMGLKNLIEENIWLYENYRKKLFFVGNLINNFKYYTVTDPVRFKNFRDVYSNIKLALTLHFSNYYENNTILTNLTQNLFLNVNLKHNIVVDGNDAFMYRAQIKMCATIKKTLNYLNSSITQLHAGLDEHSDIKTPKNLPNKIKILNIKMVYFWNKMGKLPKKIVLICSMNDKIYDFKHTSLRTQTKCVSNYKLNDRLLFIVNPGVEYKKRDCVSKKIITEVSDNDATIIENIYVANDNNIKYTWKIIMQNRKIYSEYFASTKILEKITNKDNIIDRFLFYNYN